jgi:hypothetical protein
MACELRSMTTKKTPTDRFRELAARVPPPPTSLLATAHMPAVSPEARKAAQLMVGGLDANNERIIRIAANLDRLVELNKKQASIRGRRRRGSR